MNGNEAHMENVSFSLELTTILWLTKCAATVEQTKC